MATLLERGIAASRNGNHKEAKTLLTNVLKQNNRNEQAWLWLSEVVDTVGEQITCIEQVLQINPDNRIAKLALKKLKSQPVQRAASAPTTTVAPVPMYVQEPLNNDMVQSPVSYSSYQQDGQRRPYRLNEAAAALLDDRRVHQQTTASLPAMPMPEITSQIPQGQAAEMNYPVAQPQASNGVMVPSLASASASNADSKPVQPFNFDSLPLLPIILFGTLSVTAIGGILMIGLLVLFG